MIALLFLTCQRATIQLFNVILKAMEIIIFVSYTKIHSSWELKSHKLQFAHFFIPSFLKSLTILGRLQCSLVRKDNPAIVHVSFSLMCWFWLIGKEFSLKKITFPSLPLNEVKIWVRSEKVKSYKKSLSELRFNSLISRFPHKKNARANPTSKSETKDINWSTDILSDNQGPKQWFYYLFWLLLLLFSLPKLCLPPSSWLPSTHSSKRKKL